ncbi:DUF2911 domain-containing protein [Aquimarina longa]|uniref:DUF2911 domain-containing protein n=1 Tax=Aquimarina longa TaxID=1080221 RepID=UPI0007863ABB|nr:DUF2911 domain-containing protein [Aquimarina longa]
MKISSILLTIFFSTIINAQLKTPNLSSSATIQQTIGLTEVTIKYSRPSARERIIFGKDGLLSNNEVWRTGANAATKITFSNTVHINGQLLEKGSYTILSIPGVKEWQMNWYSYENGNWNSYAEKKPVLTLQLPVYTTSSYIETLEMHFQDITINKASLVLEWEHTLLKIPILVNEKDRILKSIEKTLSGPSNFDYFQAALYLHESKTDLKKALEYIKKVTSSDKALFFQVTREALILRDLGQNKAAITVAKRGLALSKKVGNKDFIKLNTKIIQEL